MGYVRALTASATQHISIKGSLFHGNLYLVPTCDVLWNSEINTCSLPARNLALLLLIKDYGEKQKKKEEEKLVQSPFPFSLYSLMRIRCCSTHQFITVMIPKQPSCLMACSHSQSGMETEQSLEDEGCIFAHLYSSVYPSSPSVKFLHRYVINLYQICNMIFCSN